MNYVRESNVAISNSTRWALARVVAATQATGLENKQTVDSLVEVILSGWIVREHPELYKLWQERESINDRAIKAVNEKEKP